MTCKGGKEARREVEPAIAAARAHIANGSNLHVAVVVDGNLLSAVRSSIPLRRIQSDGPLGILDEASACSLVTGLSIIVAELPREPLLQVVLPLCMLLALLKASGSMSRAPCLDEARRCSERQHRVLGECVHGGICALLLMVLLLLPAGAAPMLPSS